MVFLSDVGKHVYYRSFKLHKLKNLQKICTIDKEIVNKEIHQKAYSGYTRNDGDRSIISVGCFFLQ